MGTSPHTDCLCLQSVHAKLLDFYGVLDSRQVLVDLAKTPDDDDDTPLAVLSDSKKTTLQAKAQEHCFIIMQTEIYRNPQKIYNQTAAIGKAVWAQQLYSLGIFVTSTGPLQAELWHETVRMCPNLGMEPYSIGRS